MEDLGNDMGMDIEGLMLSSPPYSTNYPQGFFDSGMQWEVRERALPTNWTVKETTLSDMS